MRRQQKEMFGWAFGVKAVVFSPLELRCSSLRLHSGLQPHHFMVRGGGATHLAVNICGFAISELTAALC
jgi:hypothetical protein